MPWLPFMGWHAVEVVALLLLAYFIPTSVSTVVPLALAGVVIAVAGVVTLNQVYIDGMEAVLDRLCR